MSKLSHTKAVKRRQHNATKTKTKRCYSRKQLQELMPGFCGTRLANLKGRIVHKFKTPKGDEVPVMIMLDKNGQIYDCTRIGNVLSWLIGRNPKTVNWIGRMYDEYVKTFESWN